MERELEKGEETGCRISIFHRGPAFVLVMIVMVFSRVCCLMCHSLKAVFGVVRLCTERSRIQN